MASAISRIHPPSSPTAGSSSTSPATRSGWVAARLQGDCAAERVRHHDDGVIGLAFEQAGELIHVGIDRPRCIPGRVAVADQIWCGNSDLGQVLVGQMFPPLAVPGEPVQCQQPHGAGRAEAVHVQTGHASIVPARPAHSRPGLTCRTPVVSFRYVLPLGP